MGSQSPKYLQDLLKIIEHGQQAMERDHRWLDGDKDEVTC